MARYLLGLGVPLMFGVDVAFDSRRPQGLKPYSLDAGMQAFRQGA